MTKEEYLTELDRLLTQLDSDGNVIVSGMSEILECLIERCKADIEVLKNNNMTYDENLRKTAEEIKEAHRHLANGGFSIEDTIRLISEYCLKKQAEAYRKGWSASCGVSEIERELKQIGLIP